MKHNMVYVVDDDTDVLRSIDFLLRSLLLDCKTFASAEEMLLEISLLPPGCILTDLRMPGMSGLDLQAELLRRGFDWPIVFMTGHGEVPQVVSAIKKGAVEFIEKPFTDERLLAALHAAFVVLRESTVAFSALALAEVRKAMQRDEIFPHYQAKVDLSSGKTVGFEALIRWSSVCNRGREGIIHSAFEDVALGKPLSKRMLECVLSDVANWMDRFIPFEHVALNASRLDLADSTFGPSFLATLKDRGVPAHFIHLEVSENVSVGPNARQVNSAIALLRANGIKIALDDFGTGYASFSHLQDLPIDYIKIDRSFVARFEEAASASMIKAMIDISKVLGVGVVAEGIETDEQVKFLLELGCEGGQGYLFGKPTPAAVVPEFCGLPQSFVGLSRDAPTRCPRTAVI